MIRRDSAAFARVAIALFLSGFSTFALLYCVQPLLPILAQEFGLDAASSSLALSVTMAGLAGSLLLAGWVSDRVGRKTIMVAALAASSLLALAIAVVPDWPAILVLRALSGVLLSGVPAVAMTYLAEELEPEALGYAMGLYIGGNAIGGMGGRLIVGILADLASWRLALGVLGLLALVNVAAFWWLLPPSRHAARSPMRLRSFGAMIAHQFRDAALPWLFAVGFLVNGAFVCIYNYASFRLSGPPFLLSHAVISLVFLMYLIGTGSSAWIGALAGRLGRRKVLWSMVLVAAAGVALTLPDALWAMIGGMALVTFGFFGVHSIASSWVSRRAVVGRSQGAALYLVSYYVGSAVVGTAGGHAWNGLGWDGVVLVAGVSLALALLASIRLIFVKPLPLPENPVVPAAP
ncbi:MFS transporter [Zavarzinia sp. CC-PAN008]|uniref:MFS transporter n=1 Tax=Zavarzinia sp. CC-PAN008 TaxID=3243332 RepID=UPI003F746A39